MCDSFQTWRALGTGLSQFTGGHGVPRVVDTGVTGSVPTSAPTPQPHEGARTVTCEINPKEIRAYPR